MISSFAALIGRGVLYSLLVGLLLIAAGQISFSFQINHNEGLVEWAQFALILIGAVVLALRHESKGKWLRYLIVAGLIVLAMEEIDWAQPYLGYTPMSILADNNLYGEMALHNSFGMENYLRLVVLFGITAGGGTLLAIIGRKQGLSGLVDYARTILLWPAALFSAGVLTMIVGRLLHPGEYFEFDEFGELAIYAGVIWFLLSRPLDILKRAQRPS